MLQSELKRLFNYFPSGAPQLFFFLAAPSPRYGIPPYLIAKDLREGLYLFHTSPIRYAYLPYLSAQIVPVFKGAEMRMWLIDSGGIKVWLDAHGLSMRRSGEIIGKLGKRNIRRGISGMGEVETAVALDRESGVGRVAKRSRGEGSIPVERPLRLRSLHDAGSGYRMQSQLSGSDPATSRVSG
jgi:hypothetical protein